jgi:RND family efflux transporter MFP subunit
MNTLRGIGTTLATLCIGMLLASAAPSMAGEEHRHIAADAAEGHDHGHGRPDAPNGDWWHRLQDWVIGALGGVHPHAVDDAAHDGERAPIVITDFTSQTELFLEFLPLVVGQPAEFLVHLTRLSDFTPLATGTVSVVLAGGDGDEERVPASEVARPGLFRISVTPQVAGQRALKVEVAAPGIAVVHDLGAQTVHADPAAVTAPSEAEPADGAVVLLKEQQWRSDFATVPVERRRLRGSVPATAVLRASADGEAHVTAPSAGRLTSTTAGFPYTGRAVQAGEILAYLAPALGGETDVASLELAAKRAESALELARQERVRVEGLLAKQAVPERRVAEARNAEGVAQAEHEAARRRLAQVTGGPAGQGAGVAVRAPLAGTITQVTVAPGSYVEQGERLFHVIDRSRLWLEARIAESDLAGIGQPTGAWFRVQGYEEVFEIGTNGAARLVAFGGMVDPVSRTVPVVLEFPNPDARLRVGAFVTARVHTGEEQEALAVPRGAIVNDAGTEIVYVQHGGERFERRVVRTGLRDGAQVAIVDGLAPGERVVSRGAYLVHLAAGTPADAGHGHAH